MKQWTCALFELSHLQELLRQFEPLPEKIIPVATIYDLDPGRENGSVGERRGGRVRQERGHLEGKR